jgi:FeS assembly SUF system protein
MSAIEKVETVNGDDDTSGTPPQFEMEDHPLREPIIAGLRTVYDPEIPVNIFELGLIYTVEIADNNDVYIRMSLTAPGCPVAGEMPGMVQGALAGIEGIGKVDVDVVWDPMWNPSFMADTAKLQLNMY